MRFAGDNFLRYSGDASNMARLQMFAWQSSQRGHNINASANPTAGELLHREFQTKKEDLKDKSKVSILEKYGGEEHLERMPKELLSGQTDNYVEYSRSGNVIKGREKAKAMSKYTEDVYPSNHTSVWGSWYDRETSAWGFGCCHSIIAASYCTGEAGRAATEASSASALLHPKPASSQPAEPPAPVNSEDKPTQKFATSAMTGRAQRDDPEAPMWALSRRKDDESADDRAKLNKAIEEEKRRRALGEEEAWQATKKSTTEVTQDDMGESPRV